MKLLSFVLSGMLLFSACSTHKNTVTQTSQADESENALVGTRWKLIELYGKPVADKINDKEPFLQLLETDSLYSASGGCNGIGGTFTLAGHGRIQFSQGRATMMACENMEVEAELTNVLTTADNYTISGKTLSLNKARMAPLARFEAVKQP